MKSSENFKLFLFVGTMFLTFFVSLLMVVFLMFGAEKIGEFLLWTGVVLSILFNVITGLLGGSEYARAEVTE
jgi:hypothetical protein